MDQEPSRYEQLERFPERPTLGIPDELTSALSRADYRRSLVLLMEAHGDRVFTYCLRFLDDRPTAEDVLQTAFLSAFANMDRLECASKAREWIFSIAHNCCMDELRRRKRMVRYLPLNGRDIPELPAVDPWNSDVGASEQEIRDLHDCLRKLKPHVRYAVLLRYQQDRIITYSEMSRICRESAAALQVRVTRAQEQLRQCLEAKGVTL